MAELIKVPVHVEDFTESLCRSLQAEIGAALEKLGLKVSALYVVGSYCFYVESPKDLDIVCIVDKTINSKTGTGYEYVNAVATTVNYALRSIFDAKISLRLLNSLHHGRTASVESVALPYFDLSDQKLYGKDPRKELPVHFHFDHATEEWLTFNLDKKTRYVK